MKSVFRIFIPLWLYSLTTMVQAQGTWPDPDSILVGDRKLPHIFLVGTFHFAYYNFDAHQVDSAHQVDILSPQKQEEMQTLIDYIARFRPTKIAVEGGTNSGYLMQRYRDYKRGKRNLGKDEIEQIGFRLLDQFNLDTLYGVNASTLAWSMYGDRDSLVLGPWVDSVFTDWDFESTDTLSRLYDAWYSHSDALAASMTLLDYFKYSNSDKVLDRGFGSYLIGDFTLGDTRGADALSLHWYNRNLRIYRRIQQITTSPEDRILVLFGAGHIEILKHLFQCSPEYALIKFNSLGD